MRPFQIGYSCRMNSKFATKKEKIEISCNTFTIFTKTFTKKDRINK